jgi:LacI family transcriptional regulator
VLPEEHLLLPVSFSRLEAYHAVSHWLRRPDRPGALFCASDELAMGAMRAAAEHGVKVPEDLAVVGFDDIAEAATNHPALTTMRQPVAEIAEHAIDTLLAFRDTGKSQPDSILEAELVRRESCGCHGSPRPSGEG